MKYAVYTGSRNLYDDMLPAVKSLLYHSDVGRVYLLIEDAEFPHELPSEVEAIDVSSQTFFKPGGPNMNSPFTYLAMMRAALCHVLPPEVDRVLSLDVDTIAVSDVSAVWDISLDGCYFAAAREAHRCYEGLHYTNTGVALYNLEMLRDGKADEIIDVLNRRRYTWVEQDLMNYLCQGRIADMPGEYNACDWTKWETPRIVHFAGHRNWHDFPQITPYRRMSWDEARRGRA